MLGVIVTLTNYEPKEKQKGEHQHDQFFFFNFQGNLTFLVHLFICHFFVGSSSLDVEKLWKLIIISWLRLQFLTFQRPLFKV